MQRRTKGSGTIQERADNKWRIRYQVQDKPRQWGSQTINAIRKMPEKALREKLVTPDSGDYVPKTKETVGEFLQSFVNMATVLPNSHLKLLRVTRDTLIDIANPSADYPSKACLQLKYKAYILNCVGEI